ncbi:FKBP-type peptidyl-prolyl cis-trans isomerase [uncultured Parabacteroides sp.]|uniref:FKBP-type peptidyl-prolyl cis-trans isomerase n=1 Tax=uncultured Parabacteroides sp. TaxID=512312 RepID=UPI0026377B1E|nr:FKBP-type peptidyl-prolyl cis-trans isomerase [uncultured Parabacteroides sp.]
MKALSMYVWSFLMIVVMGFTSCGDDDEIQFSEEQLAYITKNKEYIWEKKAEKDENGELRYKQVVIGSDTALYRILKKENDWQTKPSLTSVVYLLDLEGKFIDGQVFQEKVENSSFSMNGIIPGLSGVLLNIRLDETVEAIIPASLGYGNSDYSGIPGGSTLIFTFTLDKVE